MSTQQHTHDSSSIVRSDNLVNANSVDHIFVYRDGDDLAIETPVQTAEFTLDQLVYIYEGEMDVFEQVFESAGDILEFFWTPDGFQMTVYDGIERHEIQFVIRQQAGEEL